MTEDKTYQADERMQKFFTNLLEFKKWIKEAAENTKNSLLIEAEEKLDKIIKEGQ